MFADDFASLTTNAEDLQTMNNVVQGFCNKWRLKSNIKRVLLRYFLKRLIQVHVHGSGEIKTFQRLYIIVTWGLNLLRMVHEIVMYTR